MNAVAVIEAALFLESDPISIEELARKIDINIEDVKSSLNSLKERYSNQSSGLSLYNVDDKILLTPSKESWEVLKAVYGKKYDEKLSKAALETLSIIAYSQPMTKAEIDILRGVSADGMIRLLQKRKLIKVVGKKDIPGKPPMFGTTKEFLELFNLKSISDLPKLKDEDKEKFELNA
ncbi:SMC-Scp complex subunit ScpB [Thiospirochaeta perfilievii]|uniref:SMC-Scp complex subunit ScpB n=1 Tax=Thiospirochaeta perfilievii TaxID=252967 RepID=A0A5C1Q575_9SPIO|nr:SMC-Scp complex subunit ScpB [Thiospirochaeta perfilievii]QEN03213.1 SMC-Scp complex subunit ScpB [Thiospirochaeta perfilievii]